MLIVACLFTIKRAVHLSDMASFARDNVERLRQELPPDYIPILMPVFNRPMYLRQVLDHLAQVNNINQVRTTHEQATQLRSCVIASSCVAAFFFLLDRGRLS
mgnify:CR=1 FL=1